MSAVININFRTTAQMVDPIICATTPTLEE